MTKVLIAGTARSGKTWVGSVLSSAQDIAYLDEPDNHFTAPYAFRAKRRDALRPYPALEVGQRSHDYEDLWQCAFAANAGYPQRLRCLSAKALLGTRVTRRLGFSSDNVLEALVTSSSPVPINLTLAERLAVPMAPLRDATKVVLVTAYAHLSLKWIAELFQTRVLVVRRDLRSVLGNWIEQGWLSTPVDPLDEVDPIVLEQFSEEQHIPLPSVKASKVVRTAWLIGFLTHSLKGQYRSNPDWIAADYSALIKNPTVAFREIVESLGWSWTDRSTKALCARQSEARQRIYNLHASMARSHELELYRTIEPFDLGDWAVPRETEE